MTTSKSVSHQEWLVQRTALLEKEKSFSRLRDEISQQRRELPWVKLDKHYDFVGIDGKISMLELFESRSQLMIYHFMFGSDWEEGCSSCSFWADNFDGIDIHLAHRDISFLAVSTAPIEKLEHFRQRMGWSFRWVSCSDSDFNRDLNISFGEDAREKNEIHYNYKDQSWYNDELPGVSVFVREDDVIYHTYSTYARGVDILNGAYNYIDLAPKGRNEDNGQSWVRLHDQYD